MVAGNSTTLAKPSNEPGGNNMPAAFFIVRATVTDPAKRGAFDAGRSW